MVASSCFENTDPKSYIARIIAAKEGNNMRGAMLHHTGNRFLMLQCCGSSIFLCLLLLPKNHAFSNNINHIAMTRHADSFLVAAFGTIKEKNSLALLQKRNRPTSSTVVGGTTLVCTRTSLLQRASDIMDTGDNLEYNEAQAPNNATTTIDDQQQGQQEGIRFQRWKRKARLLFDSFAQRAEKSLFHWRRRAQNIAQTQQAATIVDLPSCLSSLSKFDSNADNDGNRTTSPPLPKGPRWAIAHPETNLSGTWKPIVTNKFKKEYDIYLQNCGTNFAFRQVCLNCCSIVREIIQQEDHGRVLHLTGTSPGGTWKRSLISSGADYSCCCCDPTSTSQQQSSFVVKEDYQPIHTELLDPDKELIKVEAWWEDQGRVHTSFLRNKPKVRGGEFESKRYLTTDEATGDVLLVCESAFHPAEEHLNQTSSSSSSSSSSTSTSPFKPAFVRWTYQRV